MDTLKAEIEAVKSKKNEVLAIHIVIALAFWYVVPVTTILIFEPYRVRKDVLVVACLVTFIFLSVSNGL